MNPSPPPRRLPRPLPGWAWLLSFLLFPPGVFLAFGAARLLPWAASLVLAVLSYACLDGFTRLLTHLEGTGAGQLTRLLTVDGGVLMLSAWGYVLYRIGERAAYWPPGVRRGWRRAGWFAAALLALSLVGIALQLVLLSRGLA